MTDYNNILVAVDFSEASEAVINRAKDIAQRNNTHLTLIHVVEYLPPIDIAYEPVLSSTWTIDEQELLEQAKSSLDKFCDKHGIAGEKHVTVIGTPKLEISQYAQANQCDLIIMGSHGRHGISLLLGSTASGVLHAMPCDVLAVKLEA